MAFFTLTLQGAKIVELGGGGGVCGTVGRHARVWNFASSFCFMSGTCLLLGLYLTTIFLTINLAIIFSINR